MLTLPRSKSRFAAVKSSMSVGWVVASSAFFAGTVAMVFRCVGAFFFLDNFSTYNKIHTVLQRFENYVAQLLQAGL